MRRLNNWWQKWEQHWRVSEAQVLTTPEAKTLLRLSAVIIVILALTAGYSAAERELARKNSDKQLEMTI